MQSVPAGTSAKIPILRLALYVTLSLLDLVLTGTVLRYSNGKIYESNPVAQAWLDDYGWQGMVFFKTLMLLIVSVVAVIVSVKNPRTGARLLTFACIVVGIVVLYSWYLLMKVVPI